MAPELLVLHFNPAAQPLEAAGLPSGFTLASDRRRLPEAAAVIFHVPSLRRPLPTRKAPGQLWVAASMESDAIYRRLRNARFMQRFDLTMTYRRDADVFNPYTSYYGPGLADELRQPPPPKDRGRLAAAFVSGRVDRSGRRRYLAELSRHIDVHSYGSVLRNRRLERDRGRPSKLAAIAGYKFTLAFENSIAEDYVTEKFFDPLLAGSVPVVLGAPNVAEFAPAAGCYVDVRNFDGPRALAAHLLALDLDEEAYSRLHAWRSGPFRREFVELVDVQRVSGLVRLCHAIRARLGAGAQPAQSSR